MCKEPYEIGFRKGRQPAGSDHFSVQFGPRVGHEWNEGYVIRAVERTLHHELEGVQ